LRKYLAHYTIYFFLYKETSLRRHTDSMC